MKCGGQQSLNKEIDIYRILRFIYKKKKFKICLLTFVSFVPLIIFIALSEQSETQHKDHWIDCRDRVEWTDDRDALQDRDEHKITIGESQKLVEQSQGHEIVSFVLSSTYIVGHKLLYSILFFVIQVYQSTCLQLLPLLPSLEQIRLIVGIHVHSIPEMKFPHLDVI